MPKNKFELHVTYTSGITNVYVGYPTKTAARKRGLEIKRKYPGIRFRVLPMKEKNRRKK